MVRRRAPGFRIAADDGRIVPVRATGSDGRPETLTPSIDPLTTTGSCASLGTQATACTFSEVLSTVVATVWKWWGGSEIRSRRVSRLIAIPFFAVVDDERRMGILPARPLIPHAGRRPAGPRPAGPRRDKQAPSSTQSTA